MQVWRIAMSQSLQRTNTQSDDVGSSRLHVYTAPSLLRILQRWVFRSGSRRARRLLSSGADLLRGKVRNASSSRSHVDPQVQRLLETLEEMSALPTGVLRRHTLAARQHLPKKSDFLPPTMWGDNVTAIWDGCALERRLQSAGGALLVQGRRVSL